LITGAIRARAGDVTAGLVDAMGWLADNVPIYAVNVLLSTATDVWALRYPEANELYVSDRHDMPEDHRFQLRTNRIHAESQPLRSRASVVFATEPMDDAARWQLIEPGELVHVDAGLQISRELVLPNPPRHQLRDKDLSPTALASVHPSS
jgi:glutamine amidotransferase